MARGANHAEGCLMRPSLKQHVINGGIDRIDALEQANGIGDKQPQKGIAHRLDAIEETQEEILTRLDKLEE